VCVVSGREPQVHLSFASSPLYVVPRDSATATWPFLEACGPNPAKNRFAHACTSNGRNRRTAAGLWMLKRWALWLSIAVCLLGGIFSWAPVIPQAPTALHRGLAAVVVVGSVLVIVLVVLPSSRRAYA
jgi:hypothetical protein